MAMPSWFTPKNIGLFILLLGGYAILLINRSIDVFKGLKYDGNEFHTNFTTTFVFGSLIIVLVTSHLLYQYNDEDLFRYLILFGTMGGIALSMMQIHFTKYRLNYATMD